MEKKAVSGAILTLLLIGVLALTFNIQPAKAESGTIYIRRNGSIDPPTANITSTDKVIYTFTDNNYYPIVVERDNIVIDGAGYKLQGTGAPPPSDGIDLTGRENVAVRNTQISNFYGVGILFSASNNNNANGNIITANSLGGILLAYSSNNNISGNTITNHTNAGIVLIASSNYNSFGENTITNNGAGIISDRSSNNSISGNTITNNDSGIGLEISYNNSVSGNTITANNLDGIDFIHCSNNSVSGNTVTANNRDGIILESSSNNNDVSGNTVTTNDYGGIRLSGSSNNSVSGNTVADNMEGIRLGYYCNYNSIEGNTITNNFYGISLYESFNNSVYHNNLIDNNQQVYDEASEYMGVPTSINIWDDGYPSGGNYWSDYEERYPDAQELDDSGIWDTPYQIDENNQDKYPLIEPWTPPPPIPPPPIPTTIENLKTKIEELGSESEIGVQGIVQSLIAKLNIVQKLVDNGKVDEAKNILNDAFIAQVQNLTGISITVEAADILVNSAEYILSHL